MPALTPLGVADLPRAVALSSAAGWNQVAADWAAFLRLGEAVAMEDGDAACPAATAAVLPFGPDLAWISMVLVRADRRREGLATALMRWAMGRLAGTRCLALDATPEGREVYRRLGFADAFGFARWRVATPPKVPEVAVRRLRDSDWPALLEMDAAAFGAPREALLRGFGARLPAASWIAADGSGYALGRDGKRAPGIGPVVAREAGTALALIGAASRAVGGPVVIDLAEAQEEVAAALRGAGGAPLRRFTRMSLGPLPGLPAHLVAMAGPEFG
jgi:GNAT superfamily N-acetyltransferase